MTLLPQVKEQLDAAAHRKVHRRRGRSLLRPPGAARAIAPTIPVAFSVFTAVAIAVIGITFLHNAHHGPSRPRQHQTAPAGHPRPAITSPGSSTQGAINIAVNEASNQTIQSDRGCWNVNHGPTIVHGSPGSRLLSQLGVLRRPAIQSPTLQTLLDAGFTAGSRVYIDYIRLAQIAYGNAFYLIPEGNPSARGPIPARCYTEMRTRLKHLVAQLPPGEQTAALQQQSQYFRFTRQQIDKPGLCFAIVTTKHVRPPYGVDSGCSSTTVEPSLNGGTGQGDSAGGQIFAAIVPDTVATATLKFSAGGKDPARTLTARAINNVVVFKIPPNTAHPDFPSATTTRAADGRIISSTG